MPNENEQQTVQGAQIEQSEPLAAQPSQPAQEPAQQQQSDNIPQAYQAIINQQQEQIAALLEQTNKLNKQITQMVQNGAQFNTQPAQPNTAQSVQPQGNFNPQSLADADSFLSMADIAKEIGKPNRR